MRLRHVTVDCADPYQLATFWSRLTGWPVSTIDQPGDDEVLVEAPDPVPGLLFVRVAEPRTVKNRVHLDWKPDARSRDAEVDRAVDLGATIHEDHRGPEDRGWVTLRDPEGNEFCIERQ
ncbi:VOC family protein [Actinoplanes xinjiangensis]|uniref:VOC family protein n=1 Tax=Actinoplanes xinjiangensis TaxID=512350 RepID=UPI00343ED808